MKRGKWVLVLGVVLVLISLAGSAWAEVKFDYGASLRLRQEVWNNVIDLDTLGLPDRDFFRFRYSFWGSMNIDKSYVGYVRLTGEPKEYLGNEPNWLLP